MITEKEVIEGHIDLVGQLIEQFSSLAESHEGISREVYLAHIVHLINILDRLHEEKENLGLDEDE